MCSSDLFPSHDMKDNMKRGPQQRKNLGFPAERKIIPTSVPYLATGDYGAQTVFTATVPCRLSNFKMLVPTSSLSHVYLLVVIPEGYNASSVNLSDPTIDLYNPTSAVICSSFDSPEYPITLSFPGSRMLRVGDKINLLVAGFNDSSDFTIRTTVEFLYQV